MATRTEKHGDSSLEREALETLARTGPDELRFRDGWRTAIDMLDAMVRTTDYLGIERTSVVYAIGEVFARLMARLPFADAAAREQSLATWIRIVRHRLDVLVDQQAAAELARGIEEARNATRH